MIRIGRTCLPTLLLALLALVASPVQADAQEFPRTEVDEALDDLATKRAQELNQAYYDYELQLQEAREEARRIDRPSLYEERRAELRTQLEDRVTRIERAYEEIRADILYGESNDRPEIREVADRFAEFPKSGDRVAAGHEYRETAERNDEVALAWAEFNAAADSLRADAERTGDWSDYENQLSRLEVEYEATIQEIERRHRQARFDRIREELMRQDEELMRQDED